MTHPYLTAQADQATAAAREQVGFVHTVASLLGGRPERLDVLPPRLHERLEALTAAIVNGELRHCGHLAGSPQPTFTALWDDLLTCRACTWRISRLDGRDDRTCDLCRVYLPTGVTPAFVQNEALIVIFGACPDCHAECEGSAA